MPLRNFYARTYIGEREREERAHALDKYQTGRVDNGPFVKSASDNVARRKYTRAVNKSCINENVNITRSWREREIRRYMINNVAAMLFPSALLLRHPVR